MARIRRGRTLVKRMARKGDNVHVSTVTSRSGVSKWYFRKDTFRTLAGPVDTTQLMFRPGTTVVVTKLPDNIRQEFKLRARDPNEDKSNILKSTVRGPRAVVVKAKGHLGLSFGRTGTKVCFPLKQGDFFMFRVISIPRRRS